MRRFRGCVPCFLRDHIEHSRVSGRHFVNVPSVVILHELTCLFVLGCGLWAAKASPHQQQAQQGQGWLSLLRLRPRVSVAVPSCGFSSAHSTAFDVCPVFLRIFSSSHVCFRVTKTFILSWLFLCFRNPVYMRLHASLNHSGLQERLHHKGHDVLWVQQSHRSPAPASPQVPSQSSFVHLFMCYVYGCCACMCACTPHMCLVPGI